MKLKTYISILTSVFLVACAADSISIDQKNFVGEYSNDYAYVKNFSLKSDGTYFIPAAQGKPAESGTWKLTVDASGSCINGAICQIDLNGAGLSYFGTNIPLYGKNSAQIQDNLLANNKLAVSVCVSYGYTTTCGSQTYDRK